MKKCSLQYGPWIFTPGWISSLTTLLLIPLFVYLSFWQMHRYTVKCKNQTLLENRFNAPAITLKVLSNDDANAKTNALAFIQRYRYHQLTVIGHFLNQYPIYLDNQIINKKIGYRILVPFKPIEQSALLLVDRGWIPYDKNHTELPAIKPIVGQQTITGALNLPANGLKLPHFFNKIKVQSRAWPQRVQRIEFSNLESLLSQKLYPFILQLNPNDPLGFHVPSLTITPPPSRHLGYAIQWLAIALATLTYYVVINTHKLQTPNT